jgi:hypothetical protein
MEREFLAAPPLRGGAARGGGQPAGLAAASAQGRRPPKAGGGPTKYHQLAFRNPLVLYHFETKAFLMLRRGDGRARPAGGRGLTAAASAQRALAAA